MAPTKPITYVLAGYDHNGAFKDEIANFEKRQQEKGDVVVLHPEPGQSLEDVVSQIKPPANVILAAHGGEDGTFTWNRYESTKYSELFAELPREGIEAVTIESCYGGTALDMLKNLPDGTLLQSQVGKKVSSHDTQFSSEMLKGGEITPFTILMESLDNIDPALFKKAVENTNKWIDAHPEEAAEKGLTKGTIDPNDVLPHTIGIGGHPPIKLNLNHKIDELSDRARAGTLDLDKFKEAEDLVIKYFDAQAETTTSTQTNEDKLDRQVHAVAKKIRRGDSELTPEETRFAYALAAANMQTTGEMHRLQEQAKGHTVAVAPEQAHPPAPQEQAPATHAPAQPKPVIPPLPIIALKAEAKPPEPKPEPVHHDMHSSKHHFTVDDLNGHKRPGPAPVYHEAPHDTHQPPPPAAPSHPSAPSHPAASGKDARIAHLNQEFGAPSQEDVKKLQENMHKLGMDLGPYGEKDAQGNFIGNDGIAGNRTQAAWLQAQKDLGINPPSEKYDPEIAQKISDRAAAQSKAPQQTAAPEQTPASEPAKPEPAPQSVQPSSAPPALSSWMSEVPNFTPATPVQPSWMTPEVNSTPMNPEMQAALQTQLAAARGDDGRSHDMEQSQSAGAAKEREQAAGRQ